MPTVAATRIIWGEIDEPRRARVESVVTAWHGTPYVKGQQGVGGGVDCVRFTAAVFDELERHERRVLPNLPQDASMHDRVGAVATMRLFIRLFDLEDVRGRVVEPGDAIVVGPQRGGPGHAIIVGWPSHPLWHAVPPSVDWCGFDALGGHEVFGIFRSRRRCEWSSD